MRNITKKSVFAAHVIALGSDALSAITGGADPNGAQTWRESDASDIAKFDSRDSFIEESLNNGMTQADAESLYNERAEQATMTNGMAPAA